MSGPAARFFHPIRLLLVYCLFAMFGAAWAANVSGGQNPDFARPAPVIDLTNSLAPYHAASAPENDGSRWYLTTVANQAVRPVTRILLAEQPYDAALRLLPRREWLPAWRPLRLPAGDARQGGSPQNPTCNDPPRPARLVRGSGTQT